MARAKRNVQVEKAVTGSLDAIDTFVAGSSVTLPSPENRRLCDSQLKQAASVRVASLFLAFYSLSDSSWDCEALPIGYRGKYGDKLLAEELTQRDITLHDAITAFGENLGWKGNKKNVQLPNDPRFAAFCLGLKEAKKGERVKMANYLAMRFAESRQVMRPLPPVGKDVLTFARAKELFTTLLGLPTEGHVPQFLIAALLRVHRARHGIEVRTHHAHAADRFDAMAGDIEEFHDDQLVRSYEVTVRTDWKNRVTNFKRKMDEHKLKKYVIIAANVNSDEELAEPARLITFLEPFGRDIAVVDIHDVLMVMAAELTPTELRESVNMAYDYLCQPKLCGRRDFQEMFRVEVDQWLDSKTDG